MKYFGKYSEIVIGSTWLSLTNIIKWFYGLFPPNEEDKKKRKWDRESGQRIR